MVGLGDRAHDARAKDGLIDNLESLGVSLDSRWRVWYHISKHTFMTQEKQAAGPTTLEIIDKLKRTVELHRGSITWEAFQNQEIERMERTTPGYGKFVKKTLGDASEEDRERLFEFAYIAYELPLMRLGVPKPAEENAGEKWWTGEDLRLQAAVLEDTFGLQPDKNPGVMEKVVARISSHVPELGEYVRDYVESLRLSGRATVDAVILTFVVSEIMRSRCDPTYGAEPAQIIF